MTKVIKCGRLIDGTGGEPISRALVVIEGDRIAAVGREGEVTLPAQAQEIDLSGKTVLPGMIDTHLHIMGNGAPATELQNLKELTPYKALKALRHAQADLEAGFTTLRDVGAPGFIDVAVKKAIEAGLYAGPRLQVAGPILSTTGGHGDSHLAPEVQFATGTGAVVDSPDAARKAARVNLKYGADLIKVSATGGVLSDGDEPGAQQLSYEEMKAAIDEAKKVGKRSASHAQGTKGIKEAIRAGVTSIDHGCFLDDEAIRMMLEHGCYLVPTLCAPWHIAKNGVEAGIPEYGVRKTKVVMESHWASFRAALQAGVKIAMGTDAATPFNYHGKNAFELQLMVEAGMPEMQAILAATKVAAELMGWEDRVGTVEAGKYADLIAVDSDPLQDIKSLQDVKVVIKGGVLIKG